MAFDERKEWASCITLLWQWSWRQLPLPCTFKRWSYLMLYNVVVHFSSYSVVWRSSSLEAATRDIMVEDLELRSSVSLEVRTCKNCSNVVPADPNASLLSTILIVNGDSTTFFATSLPSIFPRASPRLPRSWKNSCLICFWLRVYWI